MLNIQQIIEDYNSGIGTEKLALKYHVGKIKIKNILLENGVELKKRGGQKQNITYKVSDWRIEKYPLIEGFHYIAIFNENGKEFNDYMNQGGYLTSYIKDKIGIETPTLYDRRKYYMETGNYWWEQWFKIEKRENKPTKKCPYCDWETEDINNRSGAFEIHLRSKHGISKLEYIKEYPEDKPYFALVSETLNRQMSDNENDFVICAICGKKLARINDKHLRKHGMTRLEYIKKYGPNVYSKKHYEKLVIISNKMNLALENRNDIFTSKPEQEILTFIQNNGLECKKNRKILNGKELDIFVPTKQCAIEFNGNKFHTEWFGSKTRQYHLNKTKLCKEKNVKLIHIFEDEFHNSKEIVFNKIAHILGIQQDLPKIYGRKCFIKEVDKCHANTFLEKFHIQGYVSSTIHYGAFYQNELIAVMSFKTENNGRWELTRFASDYNYICCGVGGKLFKHFIREYNPESVKSFADRRWTVDEENNIYIQLGFEFDGYTPPDYKYYNPKVDRYQRFHKFGFRKQVLLKKYPNILTPEMTETEMAKKLGYDRIWDCGLIRYVWKNKT